MTKQNAPRNAHLHHNNDDLATTAQTLREAMGPGYGAALSSERVMQQHAVPYRPSSQRRQPMIGLASLVAAVSAVIRWRRRRTPVAASVVAAACATC